MKVRCSHCGRVAEPVMGGVLFPDKPALVDRRYWRCVPCRAWVACHKPKRGMDPWEPMGLPADHPTRMARSKAHVAFDALWKSGAITRPVAYEWMASAMGLSQANAHIGRFDLDQCAQLMQLIASRKP